MMADLTHRTALVTGGGQGLGRAIALVLAEQGTAIGVADIRADLSGAVAREVEQLGGRALALRMDVRSRESIAAGMTEIIRNWGKLDVLVNNGGVARAPAGAKLDSDAEWQFVMDVNLHGTVNCCDVILPHMAEHEYGKIVNISSTAGKPGDAPPPLVDNTPLVPISAGAAAYSLSKAGIIRYTHLLAAAAAPHNVNVNCVCPTRMLTQMGFELAAVAREQHPDLSDEDVRELRRKAGREGNRFRRELEPVDVAKMVAFLASDDARNITGQSINVDGGFKMA
jgi:NAD(P)-dependent dehydrogenase (short-subunit alcohol dehydrogenase family)